MSHEGKMRRGKLYSKVKGLRTNLQSDVDYFLEHKDLPVETVKPVEKHLDNLGNPYKKKKEKKNGGD